MVLTSTYQIHIRIIKQDCIYSKTILNIEYKI